MLLFSEVSDEAVHDATAHAATDCPLPFSDLASETGALAINTCVFKHRPHGGENTFIVKGFSGSRRLTPIASTASWMSP